MELLTTPAKAFRLINERPFSFQEAINLEKKLLLLSFSTLYYLQGVLSECIF